MENYHQEIRARRNVLKPFKQKQSVTATMFIEKLLNGLDSDAKAVVKHTDDMMLCLITMV